LAVGTLGCDLGLFMPTVRWLGVESVPVILGVTASEIVFVASATSTSLAEPKSLSLRTESKNIK